MIYEAPEAKIFCFAPIENIAADKWDWSIEEDNGIGGTGSEFDIPFTGGDEGDPNN